MNHRTQNHLGALKATPSLYQMESTHVVQMPTNYNIDVNLADCRVEIQMAKTVEVQMPASEQNEHNLEADLADRRVEIQGDERLKFTLQEWEGDLRKAVASMQYKRAHCINMKNELYQLVGFYTVFQGVVLTAVAQGSLLKCQTCWGPASLSLLASIATVPAVHDRLKDYDIHKNDLFWEREGSNVIIEKIRMLKRKGARFSFAEHEGMKEATHHEQKKWQFKVQSRKNHIVKWLTTLLLCLFSSIILSCCYVIPCWEISAKQIVGSQCP